MLQYLDKSDLAIKVAAWVYLEDYEEWRFAVASPRLDAAGGAKAYGLVREALEDAGLSYAKDANVCHFRHERAVYKGS